MGGDTGDTRPLVAWRRGVVTAVVEQWPGAVQLLVDVAGVDVAGADGAEAAVDGAGRESAQAPDAGHPTAPGVIALAYPALTGAPVVGDVVLLNVSAQRRGLGTGGVAFVVAIPDRLPPDSPPGPGHLVKARYTPLQAMVCGVEEQESPHHATLAAADSLAGLPVIVADLHSSLPAVIAGIRARRRCARVCYVMTDEAALPIGFSRSVAGLADAGWVHATVTTGQAFGGDYEASTVHSALLAARHVLGADVVVVAQGPGNVGTGTRWGFSGVAVGEGLNAVTALSGHPVAVLRVSQADARERHYGVSHHSVLALGRVALGRVDVVVPTLPAPMGDLVRQHVQPLAARHRLVEVDTAGLLDALAQCPVPLRTMGRGLHDDPAAFLAAAAAGVHAASLPEVGRTAG